MGFVSMGQIGGLRMQMMFANSRIEDLERKLAEAKGETLQATLRATAADKLREGSHLTREEVAAYLGVSAKKVQRMDAAGTLPRCPNMGTVVRYASRDVLRLASAR